MLDYAARNGFSARADEANQWLFCACIFELELKALAILSVLASTAVDDEENCFGDLI